MGRFNSSTESGPWVSIPAVLLAFPLIVTRGLPQLLPSHWHCGQGERKKWRHYSYSGPKSSHPTDQHGPLVAGEAEKCAQLSS